MKKLAKQAKKNGVQYVVLTAKHHEGFSLFDTAYSDYKITNPDYKKGLFKEYVDAFRAEGIRIGVYYSLIDWYHEDLTIDGMHPLRDVEVARESNKDKNWENYLSFMKIRLENY